MDILTVSLLNVSTTNIHIAISDNVFMNVKVSIPYKRQWKHVVPIKIAKVLLIVM